MKRNTQGFSLIECLIYLVLVSLVLTLTMHWLTASQRRAALHNSHNSTAVSVYTAGDLIARDLMQALNKHLLCNRSGDHTYIWSVRGYDIGWQLKDSQLIRSEGSYDSINQSWKSVTRALIAEGIEEFSLSQNSANMITYCVTSRNAHCSAQRSIALRSRILT